MLALENAVDRTPTVRAKAPIPRPHAARLPRSARSASPPGLRSRPSRGDAVSRAGSSPLPMSRRITIAPASTRSAAATRPSNRNGAGFGRANGRSSSTQPSGVAQRTAPAPPAMSATTRSRYAIASTPSESCRATRLVAPTWLATAATPPKTAAGAIVARARYAEPPSGRRAATRASVVTSQRTAATAATAATAVPYPRRRETGFASTRSCRPLSSSERSARTTANTAQVAARIEPNPARRQAA
jgi:hypothetical protein